MSGPRGKEHDFLINRVVRHHRRPVAANQSAIHRAFARTVTRQPRTLHTDEREELRWQ